MFKPFALPPFAVPCSHNGFLLSISFAWSIPRRAQSRDDGGSSSNERKRMKLGFGFLAWPRQEVPRKLQKSSDDSPRGRAATQSERGSATRRSLARCNGSALSGNVVKI